MSCKNTTKTPNRAILQHGSVAIPATQSSPTHSANFRNWFGNSKVVDKAGNPLIVYHGTNRNFDNFDDGRNRSTLNNEYQGDGFFFTPCPRVASDYCSAARNQTIDRNSVFTEVEMNMPPMLSKLFKDVVESGYQKAWAEVSRDKLNDLSDWEMGDLTINDFLDIAEYVDGSRYNDSGSDVGDNELISIFGGGIKYLPDHILENMRAFGFTKSIPADVVLPVYLKVDKLLVTKDPEKAKKARELGYDGVLYKGEGTVKDEPEFIVFSPTQIKSVFNNGDFSPDLESILA